jgi:hypothetical protein
MTEFLKAIAKTGDDDRRQYDRVPGNGTEAVLQPLGTAEFRAVIVDLSRGGAALRTEWGAAAGTEVRVLLPGVGAPVVARTVRTIGGQLALAFRQDEAMLRHVDAALLHINGMAARNVAA